MELEDALFQWVSTIPAVTSLIGNPPGEVRFYKGKIPQNGHTPCAVQQRTGRQGQELQCGPDGTVEVSLQLDWYATTWAQMAASAKAFRKTLRADVTPFPVMMGGLDSPAVFVRVKSATLENEFDGDDPEPGLYRRTQLWSFWIFEP